MEILLDIDVPKLNKEGIMIGTSLWNVRKLNSSSMIE